MRILITTDYAITAHQAEEPGADRPGPFGRCLVIAPETDQSGASHSLTLSLLLRVRPVAERTFAVRGTPTDCVIMGVRHILDRAPDLVLSGVNRGQNLGDDVTYSGTVAGAMEGTLLGIRSIAFSQCFSRETWDNPFYATGEALGPDLVRRFPGNRAACRHALQRQFPGPAGGRRAWHQGDAPGQAQSGSGGNRATRGRPRHPLLLDRLPPDALRVRAGHRSSGDR